MNDAEAVNVKLAELLRHPDDLDKILALKSDFSRKKAAVDARLRLGLQEQLNITQSGMTSISEGQTAVEQIRAELQKIDKLCSEAQNLITDFPHINLVSLTHRNFALVDAMVNDIESLEQRLVHVEDMLNEDEDDLENMPNLIPIHYELSKLRDLKDSALDQAQRSGAAAEELMINLQLRSGSTLQQIFERLNNLVTTFDKHFTLLCTHLITLVETNPGLVVRVAIIIHEEEQNDKKAKALKDAKSEYSGLAGRFETVTTNNKEIRGYKEKFLSTIEEAAKVKFDKTEKRFEEEPEKLEKGFAWWFNELNAVKLGMIHLVPKKWKIFQTYSIIYHRLMHDYLISKIDDPELRPPQMLAIVNWSDKYYVKSKKLGLSEEWQRPHIIDDRAGELIREYRELIIKAVDEWMDRMAKTDSQHFISRDESALDPGQHGGGYRTKTMADMWRMLSQQLDVASSSERTDISEGVVEAMFRALQARQRMWEQLIDAELAKYQDPNANMDGSSGFQDWLVAIANDQIACIDEDPESGISYLTRFGNELQQHVSEEFMNKAYESQNLLGEGYIDLSTHCLRTFANLIFTVDFRTVTAEFFTPIWYTKLSMKQVTTTFEDYLAEYRQVLHGSLHDIIASELSNRLLIMYLSSVRNKGAKFRRQDPFENKFKDDIRAVFEFFNKFASAEAFQLIKDEWRVVEGLVDFLALEKAALPDAYQEFKQRYWDVPISWVEATLRCRDDYDRATMNAVKARASSMDVPRGAETIMCKVK